MKSRFFPILKRLDSNASKSNQNYPINQIQNKNTSKPVYYEQKQIHAWLCTLKKWIK